ncbi:MAG TPA: SAF domain-containing protein [Marmoricola sp.]|nr:SAF domain-containing protein [Marmoricola sp.]
MKPLHVLDDVRRRILLHRRLLGALLAATAVWLAVQATAAPPPPTRQVWTAARDLTSGTVLEPDDFTRTPFAPGSVPAAAVVSLDDVLGRTLATPLGKGEPITTAHLVGSETLDGYPGRAAVAVRIPDPDVVALLTPGQQVTLVATDPQGAAPPVRVVDDAVVLAVPRTSDDTGTLTGRLVVFAVPDDRAEDLSAAATTRYLGVVWSR